MMRLNYDEMLKPYSEPTVKGGTKRTAAGQRKWLAKKGIGEAVIDAVMADAYAEIAAGKQYASGHVLDRTLLTRCLQQVHTEGAAVAKLRERTHNRAVVNTMRAAQGYRRPQTWARHPIQTIRWHAPGICVALWSFLLGMGAQWLLTR